MTVPGPSGEAIYQSPVPVTLPTVSIARRATRSARTVTVFASRLSWPLARRLLLRRRASAAELAAALRACFEALGPTYVKFGQLVASSPGAFGPEVAAQFRRFLDQGSAVPFPEVRSTIEEAFGTRLTDLFPVFDEIPIASASIAVVHRAELADGTPVAVKVVRPRMAERFAIDIEIMRPLFRRLGLLGIEVGTMLYRYMTSFKDQVAEELDLRNEARTMEYMRGLIAAAELPFLAVPRPVTELTARNVLTMEFFDGVTIDDFESVRELGVEPKPLVRSMIDFWFLTGLKCGVFHGDIHAGNLMLLRDGRLGLLDWGIVGILDDAERVLFRRFFQAINGDEDAASEVAAYLTQMLPAAEGLVPDLLELAGSEINRPFGEVDLGRVMRRGSADDLGDQPPVPDPRKVFRFDRDSVRSGYLDTSFGKANFLLMKQMLYFDLYGKLYLADEPLINPRLLAGDLVKDRPSRGDAS